MVDSACGNTADTKGGKVIIFLTCIFYIFPKIMCYCISLHTAVCLSSFLRSNLRKIMRFCTIIVSEVDF